MNCVQLTGKLHDIRKGSKVTYVTLICRDGKSSDFIDVTLFRNEFFDKYFSKGKWISILGHLHKSSYQGVHRLEVIADKLYFAGDRAVSVNGENAAFEDFPPLTPDEAENLPWETSDISTTA